MRSDLRSARTYTQRKKKKEQYNRERMALLFVEIAYGKQQFKEIGIVGMRIG